MKLRKSGGSPRRVVFSFEKGRDGITPTYISFGTYEGLSVPVGRELQHYTTTYNYHLLMREKVVYKK